MRRLIAAAALIVAAGSAGACSPGDTTGPADAAGSATVASAAGNTTEVCTAAKAVMAESTTKFGTALGKAMAAAAQGGDGEQQMLDALKTVFKDWSDGMRAQAELAQDAELKAALTTIAMELGKTGDRVKTAADLETVASALDTGQLKSASEAMGRLCPA